MRQICFKLALSAKALGVLLAAFLTVSLTPSLAGAQVLYGSIVGAVTDQNGAVVPGATVMITNKGAGQVREATTNANGEYTVTSVLPGVYDFKVVKQGFTSFTQTDLNVSANNAARVDVVMKVGDVNDVVMVAADATALQTESATVKSEISGKEINALPLAAYRNYQSLLNLVPGTTPAGMQNANTDTPERSLTTNVNGTARNNNNTRLDGAQSVNIWLPHHAGYVAPSESIQEVNVSTNNFDAEQGLAGGAAVQVITKSGTNELHGSAFGYHDNHIFQARNFFYPRKADGSLQNKPKLLRNIAGGTIGGPIVKDKVFFFGSYEGMLESAIRQGTFTVPTEAMRNGDFRGLSKATAIFNPFTGNLDGTGRTQFTDNKIPLDLINPITRKILGLVPLPNLPGVVNNYFNSAPQEFKRHNYDIKVNWNRNQNHQIWTKFSHMNALVTGQYQLGAAGGACLCDGGSGTGDTKSYIGTVGHTWTLGSGFIMDGNFSVAQRSQVVLPPDFGQNIGLDVLGIPGTNGDDPLQSGLPQFNFASTFTSYGNQNNWSPLTRDERSYTFAQNVTKLVGRHDFRFGADIVRHALNHWQPEVGAGPRGRFNFNGAETALNKAPEGTPAVNEYNAFAAFLLGTPQTAEKSLQYELMTTREWQYGFFFRDRWQVKNNLTVTLGLRYELFPIMVRADRGIEALDLNSPVQLDAKGKPNGVMQVLLGGRGGNSETLNIASSKKMFAPRLGFAWRVNDDMVVRAGYGITYDPMPFGRPLRGFFPATIAQTFVADYSGANLTFSPYGAIKNGVLVPGLNEGIREFTGPDLNQGSVPLPGTVQMRTAYNRELNRGYIQSWNLFIERKLTKDIKVEIGYVGTQTTHQLADLELNASEPGKQTEAALNSKYGRTGSTLLWDGWLSSNYHSMQVAVNRRYSNGLFLKAAYTWSKAINMTDDTGWAGLTFNSPSAISKNRALAGYDIPHNVQIGAAYELPFGRGKKWASEGVGAALLGGWAVNPIFSAVSGRPFTVTASNNTLQALNSGTQTPDLVGEISRQDFEPLVPGVSGARAPMYDLSAFRLVTGPARFGSSGRNVLRGPGYVNLDLSLLRDFRLTERFTVGLRIDTFNFTNTPHFNNPPSNMSAANFLVITSARDDQRQFRFGLRIGF